MIDIIQTLTIMFYLISNTVVLCVNFKISTHLLYKFNQIYQLTMPNLMHPLINISFILIENVLMLTKPIKGLKALFFISTHVTPLYGLSLNASEKFSNKQVMSCRNLTFGFLIIL